MRFEGRRRSPRPSFPVTRKTNPHGLVSRGHPHGKVLSLYRDHCACSETIPLSGPQWVSIANDSHSAFSHCQWFVHCLAIVPPCAYHPRDYETAMLILMHPRTWLPPVTADPNCLGLLSRPEGHQLPRPTGFVRIRNQNQDPVPPPGKTVDGGHDI